MNYKMMGKFISQILFVEAAFMLPALLLSIVYGEQSAVRGKSVGELMEDGIRSKIMQMDDECQLKLQDTMQKIVNDSNGGMVCIII